MHFASNFSTNGSLHLLLIRWHIILADLVCVGAQQSCRPRFRSLCKMSVAYLSNTIKQMQEKKIKKICTYENRINFIIHIIHVITSVIIVNVNRKESGSAPFKKTLKI